MDIQGKLRRVLSQFESGRMIVPSLVSDILRTRQVAGMARVLPAGIRVGSGAQNMRAQL